MNAQAWIQIGGDIALAAWATANSWWMRTLIRFSRQLAARASLMDVLDEAARRQSPEGRER